VCIVDQQHKNHDHFLQELFPFIPLQILVNIIMKYQLCVQ